MWRRILILPCDAKVVKRDPNFEPALDAESSGILNWLIAGAVRYHKHGLGSCEAVKAATRSAKRTGDSVAAWIAARGKIKQGATIQANEAFASYKDFCRKGDRHPLTVHRFHQAMSDKGYRTRKTNRFNVYTGIRLIEG